jgi:hypothetical protein
LRAAIELDVFRAIGEGPGDIASLARQCGASERGIRILCDYLTILGLLAKEDASYRHTPSARYSWIRVRRRASPRQRGFWAIHPSQNRSRLADIVRSGHTVLPGDGSVEPENPIWVEFAHGMAPMMGALAEPLAAIVLDGLAGPLRVLDIAAGHGLFGIEVAKLNPEAYITAVDWAAVLEVARGNARKAGVEDRYHLLPGSAFDVEYGGPYDIVLLTNFCTISTRPRASGCCGKCAALKPAAARRRSNSCPMKTAFRRPWPRPSA